MKVGILTLQLKTNYGCLLQAYAMQKFLKINGFEPITINHFNDIPLKNKLLSLIKRSLLSLVRSSDLPVRGWMTDSEYKIVSQYTEQFIKKNILTTDVIKLSNDNSVVKRYDLEGLLVGSDQCWRPRTARRIEKLYFENYVKNEIKRISYAASFGVDEWEYNKEQELNCKKLINLFNGVSVREEGAVRICKEKFGVDAQHVVDPTLLLDKTDYVKLIEKPIEKPKSLMVYVLDQSSEKRQIIDSIKKELGLEENSVMPKYDFAKVGKSKIEECVFPPVENWLNGFNECEYVVTDSFHGTVFALIFNKPFISIGNKSRGMARFTSLLKIFDLESRLINSFDQLNSSLVNEKIDFQKINSIREQQIDVAKKFLLKSLLNG